MKRLPPLLLRQLACMALLAAIGGMPVAPAFGQEESVILQPMDDTEVGIPVFVDGNILPPRQGETVHITYLSPRGAAASTDVTTGVGGTFFDNTYVPREVGEWTLRATWLRPPPDQDVESEPVVFSIERVATEVVISAERLDGDPGRLDLEATLRTTYLFVVRDATLHFYQDGQLLATRITDDQGRAGTLVTVEGSATTIEVRFDGSDLMKPANRTLEYTKPVDVTPLLLTSTAVGFGVVGAAIALLLWRGREKPGRQRIK